MFGNFDLKKSLFHFEKLDHYTNLASVKLFWYISRNYTAFLNLCFLEKIQLFAVSLLFRSSPSGKMLLSFHFKTLSTYSTLHLISFESRNLYAYRRSEFVCLQFSHEELFFISKRWHCIKECKRTTVYRSEDLTLHFQVLQFYLFVKLHLPLLRR